MRGWRLFLLLPSWRKVRASPGPVPPNPPGTCQQGHSQAGLHCGLGEITVIVTTPRGRSLEDSQLQNPILQPALPMRMKTEEDVAESRATSEFQPRQPPSTPSGFPTLRCRRPDGFSTQPTHTGEKSQWRFF